MKRLLIATVAAVTLFSTMGITHTAHADDDRRGRGRDREWNDNRRDDHDWGKGKHWNNKRYYPNRVFYYTPRYYTPPTRVVYYAPQPYYGTYYSQNFASPTTYTETYYSDGGYSRTYSVGGYLPRDRQWHPMPDYVRFGLPSPGHGQRWVRNNRDAVLISEATSRIISGIVLAASID